MKGNVLIYIFLFTFLVFKINAQKQVVFTSNDFLQYVTNYHPIAQKANLLEIRGEKQVMRARGGFDPKLQGSVDNKNYDNKEYYNLINGGLKVPTWYGIEVKAGFDKNEGVFLNPENNVSDGGLASLGISVPVGKGFIIDKRRATLKKSLLYRDATIAERQQVMNNLFFDAVKQYWKWVQAWNQYKIYEESVELAAVRFEAVKQSYIFGDKPAIDTLESLIQLQNRRISRNEYWLKYQNETLNLSNFLWFENEIPLEITDELVPPFYLNILSNQNFNEDSLATVINGIERLHPDMMIYKYKLGSADIDRKLKTEALKPKLNLNYNVLNEPVGVNIIEGISSQNYKWGLDFSFPLFLRKQRSELQLTKIKIREINLDRSQKLLSIQNKVRQYYNRQENLKNQLSLYNDAVGNYERLLDGEKKKFDAGESSLFLINSRESKLIQTRIKYIEYIIKYQISIRGIRWAAGQLYNQ